MSKKYFQVQRTMSWGEMDLFGHLNNVYYFRYLEDARIALLNEINFFDEKVYCVILKNECEYRSPVTYPDNLITKVYVDKIGNTSFIFSYELISENQNEVVATAKSIIVIVNPNGFKKMEIPQRIRKHLEDYLVST